MSDVTNDDEQCGLVSGNAASLTRRLRRRLETEPDLSTPQVQPPLLPRERARSKLAAGVPLLHLEELELDLAFSARRLARLLELAPGQGADADATAAIAEALRSGRLDLERALGEALAGHADHLAALAQWAGLEPSLLVLLLSLVVEPWLKGLARALRPLLREPSCWNQGYCPVCGGCPVQERAALEDQESFRCRRCDCGWRRGAALANEVGFRLELGEEEPDEASEALLEAD